jgi:hypothetical protein
MLSRSQTLNGFNSLVRKGATIPESQHIVMWDLEGCTLNEACKELSEIQDKFHLGEIYVVHDGTPRSYRAWCFTVVSFMRLLDILIHTRFVDWNFLANHNTLLQQSVRDTRRLNRYPQHLNMSHTIREYQRRG